MAAFGHALSSFAKRENKETTYDHTTSRLTIRWYNRGLLLGHTVLFDSMGRCSSSYFRTTVHRRLSSSGFSFFTKLCCEKGGAGPDGDRKGVKVVEEELSQLATTLCMVLAFRRLPAVPIRRRSEPATSSCHTVDKVGRHEVPIRNVDFYEYSTQMLELLRLPNSSAHPSAKHSATFSAPKLPFPILCPAAE